MLTMINSKFKKTGYEPVNLISPVLVLLAVLLPLIAIPGSWAATILIRYFFLLGSSIVLLVLLFKEYKLFQDTSLIPLYLFLLFALLSTLYSEHPFEAWVGILPRFTGFISYLYFFVIYVAAFGAAKKNAQAVRKIIDLFLISASVIAFIGLLQFWGIDPIAFSTGVRSYSTVGNSNHLGTYLLLAFPFAACNFLTKFDTKSKIIYGLIFSALITAASRGAWIGLAVGMTFFFSIFPLRTRIKTFLLLSVLIVLFLLPFNNWGLLRQVGTLPDEAEMALAGDPETGSARFFIWQKAIQALPGSLFIGTGPDTLLFIAQDEFEEKAFPNYPAKAHNIYLEIAVTMGIPALIAYLWLLFALLQRTNLKNPLMTAFYAMVIIYLAQGFFLVDVLSVYPLFWIFLGFYRGLKNNQSIFT